jgi:hypothetical protein
LPRRKIRTRPNEVGAALAAALCLAGCGSGTDKHAAPPPRFPHTLAVALAQRSDEIADALDAGSGCRALTLARALQQQTIKAMNARRVPGPLQEPLQTTVNDLAARIACVPPPPQEGRKKGHGKGKGKHKEKKHGEGND